MKKDPGNPRFRGDDRADPREDTTSGNLDLNVALFSAVRTLTVLGVFILLIVAACLAVYVFAQLGSLIRDPGVAQGPVQTISEIISADQLVIKYDDQNVEFGKLVSFLLFLFCFVLWLYVPTTLISVCSKILLGTLSKKSPPKPR